MQQYRRIILGKNYTWKAEKFKTVLRSCPPRSTPFGGQQPYRIFQRCGNPLNATATWVVVQIMVPCLGTLNNRCRTNFGDPKRDHNFDNPPTYNRTYRPIPDQIPIRRWVSLGGSASAHTRKRWLPFRAKPMSVTRFG